ncbi:MAG: HEAT repeat domain-containing protein [Desulfobacterales bacterium]|nr:HEAT repeat domain-containing protein [Desulfobacterales bacterium]
MKKKVLETLRKNKKLNPSYSIEETLSLKEFFNICSVFASEPLVVILDQFEEFFHYQLYHEGFQEVVRQLAESVNDRQTPVMFVISMREDFAIELNVFRDYLPNTLFDNFFRLEKLRIERAEDAIRKPVESMGFRYEDDLLKRLLNDLADREKEALFGMSSVHFVKGAPHFVEPPYLQIVCNHLWDIRSDKVIRKQAYLGKDGAKGFVKDYFEKVMKEFSSSEKKIASLSFNYLITPYGTKIAFPLKYLSHLLIIDENELKKVLDNLQKVRILRSQSQKGEIWYELYHDIFSKIIYEWNELYKDSESYHFRLNTHAEPSDIIELYQGRLKNLKSSYMIETEYQRNNIEPDKVFTKKQISDFNELNLELIGLLPIVNRIFAYWEAGDIERAILLADVSISDDDMYRSRNVINLLATFRSEKGFIILKRHIDSSGDIYIREEIIKTLESMKPAVVLDFLFDLLKHEYTDVRSEAASILEKIGSIESVKPLLPLLEDSNLRVRKSAISALGKIGSINSVALLLTLLKDPEPQVRSATVSALGKIGSIEAVEPLVDLLKDQSSSVRSYVADVLKQVKSTKIVVPLIDLLREQNSSVRVYVADVLRQIGSVEAVGPLIDLLKDQDTSVRSYAASALTQIGSVEAIGPLIALSGGGHDSYVWNCVAEILHRIGDVEAVVALLKDQEPFIQYLAIDILSKIGNVEALGLLADLLETHQDSAIRISAANALGEIGSVNTLKPLIGVLESQDSEVVISATDALGKIGSINAVKPLVGVLESQDKTVIPLVGMLESQDSEVLISAIFSLGQIGCVKAVVPLVDLLENNHYSKVKIRSISALGQIGSVKAVKSLAALLSDTDPFMRRHAASSLGQIGSAEIVELLFPLLRDEDSEVQCSAISALGNIRSVKGITYLIALLKNQDIFVRRRAISALGKIGSTEAVVPLTVLLESRDLEVRINAISSLGEIKSIKTVTSLVALLKDHNSEVRRHAASALGNIECAEAVTHLIPLLNDEDSSVRSNTANALGQIRSIEAVIPLIALLKNQNSYVRVSAASALGKIGSKEALTPLLTLLKDDDSQVRCNAISALRLIDSSEVINPLVTLLKDRDADVRCTVLITLSRLLAIKQIDSIKDIYRNKTEILSVRLTAAAALQSFNDEESIEFLRERSRSQKFSAKKKLAEIIGKIPSEHGASLLIEMVDNENRDVKIQAISSLGYSKNNLYLPHLHNLLNYSDSNLQEIIVEALGNIASFESIEPLKTIVMNSYERVSTRLSAITIIGEIGTEEAIDVLIELLENEETYQLRSIIVLGKTRSRQALPHLLELLKKTEKEKRKWRTIRDEPIDFYTKTQIEDWCNRLKSTEAKPYMEFELAYTIAQIDPETHGINLLSHDLAAIRKGAWLGIGKAGKASLIKKLYHIRKQTKKPWLRHASYRAIDHLLINIEAYGKKPELAELERFFPTITNDKLSEGVKTRVEWTIDRLKERQS